MKKIIQVFDRSVNWVLTILVIALLAAMTVIVLAQVIFRFFRASIIWSEEISIYMMVWCTFLGAALCCRKGTMIGLDALRSILPAPARKVVLVLSAVLIVVFLGTLSVVGFRIAGQMWSQTTPILKLPMGFVYSAIPVGAILMAVNTVISSVESMEVSET